MFRSTLFPHKMRMPGWVLLIVGVLLGSAYVFFEYEWSFLHIRVPAIGGEAHLLQTETESGWLELIENNITNEMAALLTLAGAMLIAFSKEAVEDEFFDRLRFEALVWAVKVYAILLLIGIVLLYDLIFLRFMMIALFLFFFLYIGRYHYTLRKHRKESV